MSAALSYERVREHLGALSMEAALSTLDVVLEQGQKQQRTPVEILDETGHGSGQMQCRQEIEAPPVVSGGDSAPMLEFVEGTFNQVPLFVYLPVVYLGVFAV